MACAKFIWEARRGERSYFYHRRRGFPLLRVTKGVDVANQEAVDADWGRLSESFRCSDPRAPMPRAGQRRVLVKMLGRARRRAGVLGLRFDLTISDLEKMLDEQDNRCALSGLPFHWRAQAGPSRSNPYRPSIDRIDSSKGYERNNVWLVLVLLNLAKADYDTGVLLKVCRAVANRNRTRM